MKLLVMNPNITESVTRLIGDEAHRAASPGTELTLLTAPFGEQRCGEDQQLVLLARGQFHAGAG